ncbi:MAG: hypothetical protein HY517_02675 [Candidatus Aenigmarchaeota archaeon]|nr:hypothetical protein [Candidatus Aenigmarchaeota archaeon]
MRVKDGIFVGLGVGVLAGFLSAPIYHGIRNDCNMNYERCDSSEVQQYRINEIKYVSSAMAIGGLAGLAAGLKRKRLS